MKIWLKNLIVFAGFAVAGAAWAAGESFSIGFDNSYEGGSYTGDTLYGWEGAQVAGKKWNNTDGASIYNMRLNTGVQVDDANFIVVSKGGGYRYYSPTQLGSIRDYFDGAWNFTLTGIPFSEYKVVLYMGTDRSGMKWGPVKVTSGEIVKYYTYNDEKVLVTIDETNLTSWGSTTQNGSSTGEEGLNVMVIPNLSGDVSFLTSANSETVRGGLYAIQVINTGNLEISELIGSSTSMWTFENSIADLCGGVASWTGDNNAENAFVDSLRKNESGISYKAAKMSGALHPYATGYVWPNQVTIAVYANVKKCPENGVLISSGGKTKLRKLDNDEISFGGQYVNISAQLDTLSEGYHLIVATRDASTRKISLQIDDGAVVSTNDISDISNGIQIGAEWGGGTHSYNDAGGAIFDDVLMWDKILTTDEIAELVSMYPAIVPLKLEGDGPHRISEIDGDCISLENGAILNINKMPESKVMIVSSGSVTVKVTDLEITLDEAREIIDVTGVDGTATFELGYRYGYTAEDGKEYTRIFYGTEDAFWNTPTNWYIGTIDDGEDASLIPQRENPPVAPGTVGSNKWDPVLIDGDLIGSNIAVGEDNFKTVICTNVLEGWNLRLGVMNGVHVIIDNVKKLQSDTSNNNAGWITVDEASKLTIGTLGSQSNNTFGGQFNILGLLVVTNDLTASGNNPGYNYSLGKSGKVEYQGLSSVRTHNIKSVILDLGDPELTGKTIISRQLIAFTNQVNQTFAYDSNGVTSTVDQIEVAFRASLANVGEYNFEVKADGYYVNYVAYSETDDVNVVSTWTPEDANSQWTDETLWSNGRCPDSGNIVIDTSRLDADISLSIGSSFDSVMIMGNADYSTNIDFSNAPSRVEIYGKVSVKGVNPENLIFGKDSEVVINEVVINNADSNGITVPSDVTVVLNGAEEESNIKSFGKIIVSSGGHLKTHGYIALTLESEVNGEFDVCDGKAVVTSFDRKIKGPVYVRNGAVLAPQTTDAFNYGGVQVMHIYGTLAMGSTRWTTGGDNTIYLYGGAAVTGEGNNEGNIDFNASGAGHVVVKQNQETGDSVVNFSAALRSNNNDSGTIVVDPGVTLVMSGKLINARKITKSGAGALIFDTPIDSTGGYIWVAEGSVGGKGFVQNITMAPGTVLQPVLGGLSVNGFYVNPSDTENGVILNSGRIDPEAISAGAGLALLTVKSDTINLSQSPIVNSMGSRYQTAISEKNIVATVNEGLPANFFHYDFNSEDGNTSANAASDSTWQLDSWGDVDGDDVRVPSRNGKAVRLFYQNDGNRFCAYWGGNSADESPFHAGAGTIVSVLKPQDTDTRVVWALGSGNTSGIGCVALAVDDDNTLSLIKKDGAKIVSVTGIKNLTSAYHFVAAICTPEATTLMVDDLVASSGPIVLNTIDGRGQLGSTHGANPPGYSRQGANGCYLDDWTVYDAALKQSELRALRSRLTPRPFYIRIR